MCKYLETSMIYDKLWVIQMIYYGEKSGQSSLHNLLISTEYFNTFDIKDLGATSVQFQTNGGSGNGFTIWQFSPI